VGQLRAILKEGNFTCLALCESKDSLRTEGIKGQFCWGACTWRYRKTAHIKLSNEELMPGCSERERERDIPRGNYAKKCATLE
jgi:hypothetical protein